MQSFVRFCPELVTEDVTRRLLPPIRMCTYNVNTVRMLYAITYNFLYLIIIGQGSSDLWINLSLVHLDLELKNLIQIIYNFGKN